MRMTRAWYTRPPTRPHPVEAPTNPRTRGMLGKILATEDVAGVSPLILWAVHDERRGAGAQLAPRRNAHAKHRRMRRGRRGRVRAVQDVATSREGGGTSAMRCPVRGCRQRHCRHHARGRHRVDVSWGAMQLAGEAGGSLWRQRRLPRRGLSALPAAASCRASTTRARGRRACAVERTFFVRRLHGHYSVHTTGSPN